LGGVLVGEGTLETGDARRRPRTAQRRHLEAPDPGAERRDLESSGGKRMLQRCKQGDGRKLLPRHLRRRAQERARWRRAERLAGGIVDPDAPALQLGRDPPRQAAIGRDQGGALARLLRDRAQEERDDAGLFLRTGAIDALYAGGR